jgi:hypothetical protein
MADDYAGERYWTLLPADATDVIRAVGIPVVVRKIVLYPNAANDVAVLQEYGPGGTLRTAMRIKAGTANADLVSLDWGAKGRRFNGFVLGSLSTSAVLDVYVGEN